MRFGVVGYGTGGQHFHAPFISAAQGCSVAGIVARAPATVEKVKADFPDVPVFASLSDMIAADVCDAVTITTPPHTRRDLVLEAIEAGLHVVADKPFAPDAEGGRLLTQAARDKGVTLGVYQNRRLDSDMQTLAKVIADDRLGKIWRVHNRMDFDDPATIEQGPTGGLLRDLGSHLVDQMLWLLGPVHQVDAQLNYEDLEGGRTDVTFTITLRHEGDVHSHISASKMNHFNQRELRAYGSKGSYVSHGTDVQAQAIFAGKRPADDLVRWGYEPESHWGTLYSEGGATRIPSEAGRYHEYYEGFARAVSEGIDPPVTGEQGTRVLEVLDACWESARTGRSVSL